MSISLRKSVPVWNHSPPSTSPVETVSSLSSGTPAGEPLQEGPVITPGQPAKLKSVASGGNRLRKAETVTLGNQVLVPWRIPNIGLGNKSAGSIFKGVNSMGSTSSTEPNP